MVFMGIRYLIRSRDAKEEEDHGEAIRYLMRPIVFFIVCIGIYIFVVQISVSQSEEKIGKIHPVGEWVDVSFYNEEHGHREYVRTRVTEFVYDQDIVTENIQYVDLGSVSAPMALFSYETQFVSNSDGIQEQLDSGELNRWWSTDNGVARTFSILLEEKMLSAGDVIKGTSLYISADWNEEGNELELSDKIMIYYAAEGVEKEDRGDNVYFHHSAKE
jgi:hypothetical protein